ncbi:hypothetical protein [Streptosporangium sp. NPDC006930]|uniref:hypothetical protein n=1 Tax=unclassified Streptosporangium TaxID=2632669 RepID=UPI00343D837C
MKSGLATKLAAAGASAAMLATMAVGMLATPAAAASGSSQAGTVASAAGKPKPAVSVGTPKASPSKYKGECPVGVTFSSKIKVKAVKSKTTVAYRWLHGDGSKSKVKSFTFRGKGVKSFTVKEKSTFKGNVKGWQAIQVLSPRGATSSKGHFSVTCGSNGDKEEVVVPRRVDADAWVDEGNCQAALIGRITATGTRWVHYRWVVNGEVVERDAVRVNGSRKVVHVIKPGEDFRGWAVLQVVGPVKASSNRVHFKIWCKDTSPKVWASVDGPSFYAGTCPTTRTFTGTIGASGRTTVRYRWISDGVAGDWKYAHFSGYGSQSQSVSDSWSASASGESKRAIEISGGPTTGTAVGKVFCKHPPKPTPTPTPTPSVTPTPTPAVTETSS